MTYSITPLLTGARNPDQGIMTYQRGYGRSIWLPIWAFLLRGEKTVLVDTGLDEDEFMVPAGFTEQTGLTPLPLTEALAAQGLAPEDVDVVLNTHLHDDHCGNNRLFPHAAFYVHAVELDFCRNPHPLDHRYDTYFIEDQEFHVVREEGEILPGIRVLHSPGHTPGCMTVLVDTAAGVAAITGFCCNAENFPANGPAICPGVHTDALAAWDSIQRVKGLGATILPMHELRLPSLP
ncbi:MAG: N-acyl homoserine lactonase family protein [Desulfovibrionaceae bacterium]|nr:N-acyl homoserine lactonase family protein [Desulfovibrionaceae bacterium]